MVGTHQFQPDFQRGTPFLIWNLSLNAKELGVVSAVFFAFALTKIPVGILLDRLGTRGAMTLFSLGALLGAVVFSWPDSLSVGIIRRVLMGVGMACNLIGTLKLLTTWFGPTYS